MSSPTTPDNSQSTAQPEAGEVLAFPATIAQQAFWYLELFQEDCAAFNIPLHFQLDGPLDVDLLRNALNAIIDRHEILRTHFTESDGEIFQIVEDGREISLPVIDLTHLSESHLREEINRLGEAEARIPFDLSTGPVLRTELLRQASETHILHFSVHHAVFDGLSIPVFINELTTIYQNLSSGNKVSLTPLSIQYGDFSVWQSEFLKKPTIGRQLDYWKTKLKGMRELEFPTDRPRQPVKSWKGDIESRILPKSLSSRLARLASSLGTTSYHLQLAAFKILLHRYCDTTDVALGTPVNGRTRNELQPLIGVFINSLILRTDLSKNPAFGDFLQIVRDNMMEAMENQDIPFEYLVRELHPIRDQSRNPLFQINFNHHRSAGDLTTFDGISLSSVSSPSPGSMFDLHLLLVESDDGWRASCDYSTDLFDRSTAERVLAHFEQLLTNVAEHPETPVFELEIIPDTERNTIIREWSATRPDYSRAGGQLFAKGPIYLLDSKARVVPVGVPGTLYLTGGKSTESLPSIEHPEFGSLFATGDTCHWTASGSLAFIRSDAKPAPAPEIPLPPPPPIAPLLSISPTELSLIRIWGGLLGTDHIGVDDAFFNLGGHSLMALRMFSQIKRELGCSLPMATLISNPTIRSLATAIDLGNKASQTESAIPSSAKPLPATSRRGNLVTLASEGDEPPLFCIHGGDGGIFFYRDLIEHIDVDGPVHAIESLELSRSTAIEPSSIEETAEAYLDVLLAFQKDGSFRLAGYSFGGVVAHEMACRLTAMGHRVEFVGLFDTQNPAAPIRNYSLGERLKVFWQDSHDQPLAKRISSLGSRIRDGVRTNRRIRNEQKQAIDSGPAEAYSDLRRIQVREENWRAMQVYQPKRFTGRLTLFKSSFVNDKVERPVDYGWSSAAESGLDIVSVTGHHLEIFDPEHIGTLSNALEISLKRSSQKSH